MSSARRSRAALDAIQPMLIAFGRMTVFDILGRPVRRQIAMSTEGIVGVEVGGGLIATGLLAMRSMIRGGP